MPQQWLVKRPQASGGPPPAPPDQVLPNAILGTPVLTTPIGNDNNDEKKIGVAIPVSFASGSGDVDRFWVHLFAPDTAVDTQEGFTGGPGSGATVAGQEVPGIIIGDAANASKIVSIQSSEVLIEKPWNPDRPFIDFEHPVPAAPEYWKAIVVTASAKQKNSVSASPSKRFYVDPAAPVTGGPDVSGVEYAPLALNFRLIDPDTGAVTGQPYYSKVEGGAWKWGFSCAWQNDTKDPRYPSLGGYDIEIEYPDGKRELHASKSANDLRHDSPLWDIGAPGRFTVRCISWSSQQGNPRNSVIADLTPHVSFNVAAPVGPAGKDYADNITNLQLVNPYYGLSGQGQKALFLPFRWTKPADLAYGGCMLTMIRSGAHYPLTGQEPDDEQLVELFQYPGTGQSESVTVYARSVSASGNVNEYIAPGDPGIPPKVATPYLTFTIFGPASSTPAVAGFFAEVTDGEDQFGNKTYGYRGNWNNPDRTVYPEYQGVRIFWTKTRAVDAQGRVTDRKDLTGVITGNRFETEKWPRAADSGIWIYAISVDVNGAEGAFNATSTPHAGPLVISELPGTIHNEALPDINAGNFAAGIEPVSFVNAAPTPGGVLSGVAKITTSVFNQNDQRMYRWKQPLVGAEDGVDLAGGGYKVVGTAPDLVFRSITGGLIAVGAVSSLSMATQFLDIGPAPITGSNPSGAPVDRPAVMRVWTNAGVPPPLQKLVGLFGTYSGWEGIYALNLRVGPNFTSPVLEATATGLTLSADSSNPDKPFRFYMRGGLGHSILMDTTVYDPTYNSLGMSVQEASDLVQTWNVSRGIVGSERLSTLNPYRKVFSLVRSPFGSYGELALYSLNDADPSRIRVLLSANDPASVFTPFGVVRADRFDANTLPGVTGGPFKFFLSPGGFCTIAVSGGIITQFTYSAT